MVEMIPFCLSPSTTSWTRVTQQRFLCSTHQHTWDARVGTSEGGHTVVDMVPWLLRLSLQPQQTWQGWRSWGAAPHYGPVDGKGQKEHWCPQIYLPAIVVVPRSSSGNASTVSNLREPGKSTVGFARPAPSHLLHPQQWCPWPRGCE